MVIGAAGAGRLGSRSAGEDSVINDILSDGEPGLAWPGLARHDINNYLIVESLQPYFPSIVENVTVSYGRKAVLKCEVENLRNYKVCADFVIGANSGVRM